MLKMNVNSAKNRSALLEFLGGPEKFKAYEKCSSHRDRVAMIYQIPMVQALFQQQKQMLKSEESTCKNDRESKRLRELGNQAFKSSRDRKALELYTEAICYADPNAAGQDQALALALANRSAVQIKFPGRESLQKAIKDINRALKAGHPAPMKLMERKLNCQIALNNVQEAKETLEELIDLDEEKKNEYRVKIKNLKTYVKNAPYGAF